MKLLTAKISDNNTVLPYDSNLNAMRTELDAAIKSLSILAAEEAETIRTLQSEITAWDGRWDKCRLYLEQDDLSGSSIENISELQIIALHNIESAQELLTEAKDRKTAFDNQHKEALLSLSKLNSMEARQALLSASPTGKTKSYIDSEEYRAIRTTIATVQGFISLRSKD